MLNGLWTSQWICSMFRLWKKLSSNVLLCARLFEFMKVAKLVVVQIMDSMKDERTFSTLTFMGMEPLV
jgi:hypothetical protein